ncbi:hypothetical protein CJD36_010800 [Flavipsychrobacter stenotrophus]|uniref:HPt domain-containing protein n=1 Tax=Flavipsychrobacter stenotrophus TaxID=2077091 RepID=A0A2S7SV99_9BACT|nr:Hpt domain-containing protein [Flavipsychrobacter stenotrophus]PQJ10456.1 hypothetical protein CJD36_010800 [Flavipsychrobacter stenotrophus]
MMPENNYRYIDLETILEMADGESDFIISIISVYLTSIPESLEQLILASGNNDTENIVFYVHKLKGSFNFIGCTLLTDIFLKIEAYCTSGEHMEEIPALVAEVEKLAAEVTLELQDVMEKVSS